MTPTASGKSLIYNIPVIESIIENPEATALYIFPLKGLEQDQVKNLNELLTASALGIISHPPPTPSRQGGIFINPPPCGKGKGGKERKTKSLLRPAEVYDGDTTAYRRGKIRKAFQKGLAGKQNFPRALMLYSQTLICCILQ